MNLSELKTCLQRRPELNLALVLPDGRRVPAHFHVTEVGHIAKNFVDCGGTFRRSESYVLQTHVGSTRDDGHRLTAGRLAKILALAQPIVSSEELPVEVEYEDGLVSQFSLQGAGLVAGELAFQLAPKHTDCLAKEKCGIGDEAGGCGDEPEPAEGARCCAGPAGSARCC
jgi:hypothetical protein